MRFKIYIVVKKTRRNFYPTNIMCFVGLLSSFDVAADISATAIDADRLNDIP